MNSAIGSEECASSPLTEEYDVIVVGAGFAGLYQLDRLRSLGFSVKLLERGGGPGGVWYWNAYPGCRVDSEGLTYQYSREGLWRDWDISERFPSRNELYNYFKYVDEKLDLSRDIYFKTEVIGAEFDENELKWNIRAKDVDTKKDKNFRAQFMILCLGFASKPYIPAYPGLETFKGVCHHTGLWPQDGVELAGKRVAVIGTGASGVQVIQEVAPIVKHLTVYQRTPNTAMPMQQHKLSREENQSIKADLPRQFKAVLESFAGVECYPSEKPTMSVSLEERIAIYEKNWAAGGFNFWLGTFSDVFKDKDANIAAYEFWRDKVRARIKDPILAEKLAPTKQLHPFGTKRPSLEQRYYEVFNQDNVDLVDTKETSIVEVTPTGIRTTLGEQEFDVIILATGFDAVTGGLKDIDLRSVKGQSMRDRLANGVEAYLGYAMTGYPNMLMVYGPQSPTGFCNGATCAEHQGEWVVKFIDYMRRQGYSRLEANADAEEAWTKHAAEVAAGTLFDEAESWYVGANIPGKTRQLLAYAGGQPAYFSKCQEVADNDYEGFTLY